ncbi:MAG TPA: LysR family transcriptional regulator [Oribacterium sp.]|nr:LysR family transcriptional regulator [Oribacterium sp.]
MELKDLQLLIAIYEEKSISHAAERLYMAQSSLSQFLTNYEQELGCRLFVRTASGVRPTEAGELLLSYAYRTVSEYKRVQDEMQDTAKLKSGSVILGINTFRGSYVLPPVVNAFHMKYPNIHIKVIDGRTRMLEQLLLNGDLDLALLATPDKHSRIESEYLMTDEICLITGPTHPIMKKAKKNRQPSGGSRIPLYIDLQDAADYEFNLCGNDTMLGQYARRIFAKNRLSPITYNENMSVLLASSMGAAGQGLAFTYYSSRHYFRNAEFLSLGKDGGTIEISTALAPGRYHSKATLALQEVMHEILGDHV